MVDDHLTMILAAWANLILYFHVIQKHVAATADRDLNFCILLFALNVGVELAHGFVPLGDVAFHTSILQRVSTKVKHFLQRFSGLFFFVFGTRFARANLMPKLFQRLAHHLLGTPSNGGFAARGPPP
jgi:hypothetical protein